jgi:hypothetical protein
LKQDLHASTAISGPVERSLTMLLIETRLAIISGLFKRLAQGGLSVNGVYANLDLLCHGIPRGLAARLSVFLFSLLVSNCAHAPVCWFDEENLLAAPPELSMTSRICIEAM